MNDKVEFKPFYYTEKTASLQQDTIFPPPPLLKPITDFEFKFLKFSLGIKSQCGNTAFYPAVAARC